jgi:hypothetical protein
MRRKMLEAPRTPAPEFCGEELQLAALLRLGTRLNPSNRLLGTRP